MNYIGAFEFRVKYSAKSQGEQKGLLFYDKSQCG